MIVNDGIKRSRESVIATKKWMISSVFHDELIAAFYSWFLDLCKWVFVKHIDQRCIVCVASATAILLTTDGYTKFFISPVYDVHGRIT